MPSRTTRVIEEHCSLHVTVLTNSLYISFWSQSSGSEPNFSWVFCEDIWWEFIYSSVVSPVEVISVNWGKSLPEWSVRRSAWPLSGTWAFPGQHLSSTLSCSVCRMCRCSGWTSQGTGLEPNDMNKHKTIHSILDILYTLCQDLKID